MAMRQYRIITKTPDTEQTILQPAVHSSLYNIPEVREAVAILQANEKIEMIGIRIGSRYYSLVVAYGETLMTDHFELETDIG